MAKNTRKIGPEWTNNRQSNEKQSRFNLESRQSSGPNLHDSNRSNLNSKSINQARLVDIYRYRINFDRMIIRFGRIKSIICAGSIFHLSFILTLDFLSIQWSSIKHGSTISMISMYTIIQSIALMIGLLIGCQMKPQRHLFMFNPLNTFHLNWLMFMIIASLDVISMILDESNSILMKFMIEIIKNVTNGIAIMLLLYSMFDIRIDRLQSNEAIDNINLYQLMFITGSATSSLISFMYNLTNHNISSLNVSLLMCRILLSLNWSTFSYILFYSIASIHRFNDSKIDIDFDEFLENHRIDCERHITLNSVVLACQWRHGIDADNYLNADNFSIRTINDGWHGICFALIGSLQFMLAFHLCLAYPMSCTVWPRNYYSNDFTDGQISTIFATMLAIMISVRLSSLIQFDMTQNFPKKYRNVSILSLNIIGNMIILIFKNHFWLILLANICVSISLSQILNATFDSIAKKYSINNRWICCSIVMALSFQLLMSFLHYYLINELTSSLINIINITITMVLLISMIIIDKCECLNINNGFDLSDEAIEMDAMIDQQFSNENTKTSNHSRINNRKRSNNRKQSIVAMVAYRMRNRYESIVSNLIFK